MAALRPPAVAGSFYPAGPSQLKADVAQMLGEVPKGPAHDPAQAPAKAYVVPHAGYVYSGPVAATVYAQLAARRGEIRRVILLGPAHRVPLMGLAAPSADAFATPLGDVPLDQGTIAEIATLPQVRIDDRPHEEEHCLEVQLPFLQACLDDFTLVPLVVGEAAPAAVAQVLEHLWGGPETVILISSDLSHYLDYDTAKKRDAATAEAIEDLNESAIGPHDACGCRALSGLLREARRRHFTVTRLDLRNSGDTAGPRDRVVGYGAWVFGEGGEEAR